MKKLRRNLTSGLFLFIFLMIIEVLLVVFVTFFLEAFLEALSVADFWVGIIWGIIKFVEAIVVLVLFHKILNRHEDPEFKIAWLVGLVALPFFVFFLYLIFGNRGISKKEKHVVTLSKATYVPYLKEQHKKNRDNDSKVGDGLGAFNYIKNTSGMDYHSHNRVTYYKNGEKFFPAMIKALK